MKMKKLYIFSLMVLLPVTMFVACNDKAFDPFEEEIGLFSIYGLLRAGVSPTYIRVKDLSEPLFYTLKELDYTVTFEDLETGSVSTLRDSIFEFSGNYTRNFIINEQIEEDRHYRIKVVSADGFISQSDAKTPKNTEVILNPMIATYKCNSFIEITFKNVTAPENIELEFTLNQGNTVHKSGLNLYKDQLKRFPEINEFKILMRPQDILNELFEPTFRPSTNPYESRPSVFCEPQTGWKEILSGTINVSYTHLGREWASASRFGGLINIESGDVKNGLGFFGSIHEGNFTISW